MHDVTSNQRSPNLILFLAIHSDVTVEPRTSAGFNGVRTNTESATIHVTVFIHLVYHS